MMRNQAFLSHILQTLRVVMARRSSDATAISLLQGALSRLMSRYPFLDLVGMRIQNEENSVNISSDIDFVDPALIGASVQSLIRLLCLDLEEENGLFFIKEFKDKLGGSFVAACERFHVDLEVLQLEQLHLHELLEKRRSLVPHASSQEAQPLATHLLSYTWESLASFTYRNNYCYLYDADGKRLDKLRLNDLLEFYIRTITDFERFKKKEEHLDLSDKEIDLLITLHSKDMDKDVAQHLLGVSEEEFFRMVKRLLQYELLQSIADDEIRLTEKGVAVVEQRLIQKKGIEASR